MLKILACPHNIYRNERNYYSFNMNDNATILVLLFRQVVLSLATKQLQKFATVFFFFVNGQLPTQTVLFIQTTSNAKYEQTTPVYTITYCTFLLFAALLFCLFCLFGAKL